MNKKIINETGNRYGRLLVIERVPRISKFGGARWRCICDCGKETIVYGVNLRRGWVKSCGCFRSLPEKEASFNDYYSITRKHALQRNYSWELSKEEFRELTQRNCYYCGVEPKYVWGRLEGFNGFYIYNGVDRIDNSLGYTIENSVPCCGVCNRMKSDMGVLDFKNRIISIYNRWASK